MSLRASFEQVEPYFSVGMDLLRILGICLKELIEAPGHHDGWFLVEAINVDEGSGNK